MSLEPPGPLERVKLLKRHGVASDRGASTRVRHPPHFASRNPPQSSSILGAEICGFRTSLLRAALSAAGHRAPNETAFSQSNAAGGGVLVHALTFRQAGPRFGISRAAAHRGGRQSVSRWTSWTANWYRCVTGASPLAAAMAATRPMRRSPSTPLPPCAHRGRPASNDCTACRDSGIDWAPAGRHLKADGACRRPRCHTPTASPRTAAPAHRQEDLKAVHRSLHARSADPGAEQRCPGVRRPRNVGG